MTKEEREKKLEEKLKQMMVLEGEIYEKGDFLIGGVDEVGRGPLAGPVVAACVVLPKDFSLLGVDDSKKLGEKKRLSLASQIKEEALAFGLGMANEKIIDEINILEATKGAMKVAISQTKTMLEERGEGNLTHLLIDGMTLDNIPYNQQGIIKGDGKSVSIAAASILAKVTRDHMMVAYDSKYPGYGFAQNKGYGTKAHYDGLNTLGSCPIHRMTFLRKWKESHLKP